jgi:hypothetical protein
MSAQTRQCASRRAPVPPGPGNHQRAWRRGVTLPGLRSERRATREGSVPEKGWGDGRAAEASGSQRRSGQGRRRLKAPRNSILSVELAHQQVHGASSAAGQAIGQLGPYLRGRGAGRAGGNRSASDQKRPASATSRIQWPMGDAVGAVSQHPGDRDRGGRCRRRTRWRGRPSRDTCRPRCWPHAALHAPAPGLRRWPGPGRLRSCRAGSTARTRARAASSAPRATGPSDRRPEMIVG